MFQKWILIWTFTSWIIILIKWCLCSMWVSLIGAIGVIIGLYVVLWGKAEDVVHVKEKIGPKSMDNETEEVKILITDLKETLLTDESTLQRWLKKDFVCSN